MSFAPRSGLARTRVRVAILYLFALALLLPPSTAFGQQTYVSRFNTYIGYYVSR